MGQKFTKIFKNCQKPYENSYFVSCIVYISSEFECLFGKTNPISTAGFAGFAEQTDQRNKVIISFPSVLCGESEKTNPIL